MNETGTPADDAMKRDASIGKKKGFIAKIKDLFAKPKKVEAATGSITTTEEMWNQIGFHRVTGRVLLVYPVDRRRPRRPRHGRDHRGIYAISPILPFPAR